ncbi:malate synthase A [Winogradskyella bathintestinalis]|uniref:Malate synthase n=1 Tax=Winogradskyella bathintestinalis TaxID=3035208 RepID=A0ABT7ZWD7_9FLAO|nr:malate synthase A [Winogradskyella bathintestinalis]MDN3493043.1 malate synthase A [Winogradskyella bathintestinalis]
MEITAQQKMKFAPEVADFYPALLTEDALKFLSILQENFNATRLELLNRREMEQSVFDKGVFPSFPAETKSIRESDWVAAEIPQDLLDRRVEITGPVNRKMVINALNSGAKTFMADFEDSNAPSWKNSLEGQQNLKDANERTIELIDEARGKHYKLNDETAVLLVRPRGLHLNERHLLIDGQEMSGSLFDFGLYVFHNSKPLMDKNSAPYFYLPKLEHYLEARWWNAVFEFAQNYLEIPNGTFKATLLIETITASFQLDEFIYELKEHIVGLNCGRWDYIFSYIKKFRNHDGFIVPNRDQVTMETPFMAAYSNLVIQRCHKRGIHAMGGMAAQIPIKNNHEANKAALEKVRIDKEREAKNGHDGTWVAHPALVSVAMSEFDKYMPTPNQIFNKREDLTVTEADLVELPQGTISEKGIRKNMNVGILYLEAWLRGYGAVALYNLMEDAATAEISRTQIWQWLKNEAFLNDGRIFNKALFDTLFKDEVEKITTEIGEGKIKNTKFSEAIALFKRLVTQREFEEFLTLSAYQYI